MGEVGLEQENFLCLQVVEIVFKKGPPFYSREKFEHFQFTEFRLTFQFLQILLSSEHRRLMSFSQGIINLGLKDFFGHLMSFLLKKVMAAVYGNN